MSDFTTLELETLRGVTDLLRPAARRQVWEEVSRMERKTRSGVKPRSLGPSARQQVPAADSAEALARLRQGLERLPPPQRRLVEAVAKGALRARLALLRERAGETHRRAGGNKDEPDHFHRLLDAEDALRVAASHKMEQSSRSSAADAFMERLTRLARGFYKSSQAVLNPPEAVLFAAEAVARFFREGGVEEACFWNAQGIVHQTEVAQEERGFAPVSFDWARQMLEAAESLAAEVPRVSGESVAQRAREWTLIRFGEFSPTGARAGAQKSPQQSPQRRGEPPAGDTLPSVPDEDDEASGASFEDEMGALERLLQTPEAIKVFGEGSGGRLKSALSLGFPSSPLPLLGEEERTEVDRSAWAAPAAPALDSEETVPVSIPRAVASVAPEPASLAPEEKTTLIRPSGAASLEEDKTRVIPRRPGRPDDEKEETAGFDYNEFLRLQEKKRD